MKKYVILLFATFCFNSLLMPQNSCKPRYDMKILNYGSFPTTTIPLTSGWILSVPHSDEFNSFNTSKWRCYHNVAHKMSSHAAFKSENVTVKNGMLVLSMKKENPPLYLPHHFQRPPWKYFYYSSGYIEMIDTIRYGYLEARCYLPNSLIQNACFWLFGNKEGGEYEYDEIDVFEKNFDDKNYGGPNVLMQNVYHNLESDTESLVPQFISFSQPATARWATFAVEWLPKEITFYIDGHITSRLVYNPAWAHNSNIFTCGKIENAVRQRIQLSYSLRDTIVNSSLLNEEFKVDYVRCYKLKEGFNYEYWPTSFSMSDPYIFRVHKKLRLGGAGRTAFINTSTNITLWAKEEIVFEKGFEVSAGTPFTARRIDTDPQLFIDYSPGGSNPNLPDKD